MKQRCSLSFSLILHKKHNSDISKYSHTGKFFQHFYTIVLRKRLAGIYRAHIKDVMLTQRIVSVLHSVDMERMLNVILNVYLAY